MQSQIFRIGDEDVSILLPPTSSMKETVNVYLRVKPKTTEELEFYSCRDETELGKLEDDNFDVVKIESRFQVIPLSGYLHSFCNCDYLIAH